MGTRIGSKAGPGQGERQAQIDPTNWVEVDDNALADDRREQFLRRKHGVNSIWTVPVLLKSSRPAGLVAPKFID